MHFSPRLATRSCTAWELWPSSLSSCSHQWLFFRAWEMEKAPRVIAGMQELVLNREFPEERGCSSTPAKHPPWRGWE